MFIQGRVFDDVQLGASTPGPNESSRKTLARIAFEEVQDEYTVSYGNQTRKLWGNAGGVVFVQECRGILGSLSRVVRDLKDRMAVEIGREDLQAAFVASTLAHGAARSPGPRARSSMPRCSMLATLGLSCARLLHDYARLSSASRMEK